MRKLVKTTKLWSHIAKATRIGEVRKLKFSFVKQIVLVIFKSGTFENNQYEFSPLGSSFGLRHCGNRVVHPSTKKYLGDIERCLLPP